MAIRPLVSIYKVSTSEWVGLPTPSEYTGISTTIVDTARNVNAQVIGQVVKSDVAKIELTWNYLTVAQYSALAQLFESKYGGSFFVPVSFFDEISGAFEGDLTKVPTNSSGNNPIRMFYCGDRKAQVAHITLDANGMPIGYSGVSLNLIDTGFLYGEQPE